MYILYHGILLAHVDGHMKQYVKANHCRRKELLKHFNCSTWQHEIPHLCCHNCAADCECSLPDCGALAAYPCSQEKEKVNNGASIKKRQVDAEQRKTVEGLLVQYYKTILIKLLNTTARGDVKTLTNLQFMLGFSEHQITQVLDNLDVIVSLSDVYRFVEIWDMCHARESLKVISNVFNDVATGIQSSEPSPLEDNGYDADEELLDEWNEFLQDDDLFEMIVDNLSLSQIDDSLLEQEPVCTSQETELPSAVLATVEAMNLDDLL